MASGSTTSVSGEYQTETIEEINIEKCGSVEEALKEVQGLVKEKGLPALLTRTFTPVSGTYHDSGMRVMQFNILAQGLSLGGDNFIRCPKEALVWNTRRIRIMEEILTVDPDLLCLQEVDHFGMFKTLLGPLGYDGTFIPKPDSPALLAPDTNGPDGCALFFRRAMFDPVTQMTLGLKDKEMSTNQVAIINKLKHKPTSKVVTIATTHLKAKKGYEGLRLSQGSYLLDYITESYGDNPVIICGDFNAEPTEGVYKAYTGSKLGLRSAYATPSGKEANYTTWKIRGTPGDEREYCRTIDYIWYTPGRGEGGEGEEGGEEGGRGPGLVLAGIRDLPTPEQIGPDRLPSYSYPSDHLSIAADFNII